MTPTARARILLVEDEENVALTVIERLRLESYDAHWARTLEDARLEVTARKFDLILLDVGLPDGSGFDFAQELRNKTIQGGILFLTAFGTPEDRVRGLELGAEDYVVKPFSIRELLLRIQNALKRAHYLSDSADEVKIGRARVGFAKHEAYDQRGQLHRLTQKESALLKFLYERAGAVVSRDEILNFVWSDQAFPTTRTIDNFILKLRRIVEDDPENPKFILSIRGVGYQLVNSETTS